MKLLFLLFVAHFTMASPNFYKNGKLVVSTHYSPPWSYKDCRGAEIDIIRLAFKEVGIEITCKSSSYGRLVANFLAKKTLFASPVVKSDGNKVGAFYSDSFISYVDIAASFNNSKISFKDLESSNLVAYQNASDYLGKRFKHISKKAKSYNEIPGRDGQVRMLGMSRVDYVVGEQNILNSLAKKIYPNRTLYNNMIIKKWDVRAGSHDKVLMMKFNKGLRIIKKKGKIKEIYSKYGVVK